MSDTWKDQDKGGYEEQGFDSIALARQLAEDAGSGLAKISRDGELVALVTVDGEVLNFRLS